MTLDFSAPIRVTWAVPTDGATALRVWERLAEGRVLFAELMLADECGDSLKTLLSRMSASPAVRVVLLGPSSLLVRAAREGDPGWLARTEAVVMPPFAGEEELQSLAKGFGELALGLWSTEEGMGHFDRAIRLADSLSGVTTVSILNPTAPVAALSEIQRQEARRAWDSLGYPDGVTLKVHDLFLSEALGLDPFATYGGCAAAGALAHVTENGELVACRTLPHPIGDLLQTSLRELWAGEQRKALQAEITRTPGCCEGCSLEDTCRGGCPGLQGPAGRDNSCEKIRKTST